MSKRAAGTTMPGQAHRRQVRPTTVDHHLVAILCRTPLYHACRSRVTTSSNVTGRGFQ
jgi:hypothetical protein